MTAKYLYVSGTKIPYRIKLLDHSNDFSSLKGNDFSNYRISPIFPVNQLNHVIPSFKNDIYAYFIFFKNAFSEIGHLLNTIDANIQSNMWFNHGLASLIVFSHQNNIIELIKKKKSAKSILLAWECWTIKDDKIVDAKSESLPQKPVEKNSYEIIDFSTLIMILRF